MHASEYGSINEFIAKNLSVLKNEVHISRKNLDSDTIETLFVCYKITNSIDVILQFENMKPHPVWALDEVMTEMLAMNPGLYEKHFPNMAGFMNSFKRANKMYNYLYGARWHYPTHQQLNLYERFKKNLNTRQGVSVIYTDVDTLPSEFNIPCTDLHQFIYRNGGMNLTTYFRSSDIFRGYIYDVFLSSFLCQMMASWLDVNPGQLIFFHNSFHVYKEHYERLAKTLEEIQTFKLKPVTNEKQFSLSVDDFWNEIWRVKDIEEISRHTLEFPDMYSEIKSQYFKDWANIYLAWNLKDADLLKQVKTSQMLALIKDFSNNGRFKSK